MLAGALVKIAFATSQYSGPLNPVIASGASYLPPPKKPQLQSVIQKVGELWPGFFDELSKTAGDVNIGQWWENVGGPHLAQGGDHKTFKTMMHEAGIPPAFQSKFERVAKEKYPAGHQLPGGAGAWGSAQRAWRGQNVATAARVAGKVLPFAVATGLVAHSMWRNKKNEAAKAKKGPGRLKAAAFYKLEGDAVIETDKKGKSLGKGPVKEAAGAPTRGNFMMASDVPPFKAPRLDRAIQKEGDMLPDGVTMSPSDFKKSKYAMPLEDMRAFVHELLKEGSITSPAAQLQKSQSVGAPKAAAPPGPSIAQIAKPKGPKFGVGIAGAFKGSIGGTGPQDLT